jgi:hypothetical protein
MRRINRFPMTRNIVLPRSIFICIRESQWRPNPRRMGEKRILPLLSLHFLIKKAAVNSIANRAK